MIVSPTCALMVTMPLQQGQYRMPAHTCKQTYHMCVFAHTLANISYVQACESACKPCKPLLWASAWQISLLPLLPPLFCNICVQKLGSIVHAKTRKHQQKLCWCYKNELLVIVLTWFLGRIGFLSRTASSQPSQQGKEGLDKGVSTDSKARLSNCVHCWMHQGERGLTSRRGKSHIGNFGLAQNLSLFFLGRLWILCCVPQNHFSGRKWVSTSKKNSILPPAIISALALGKLCLVSPKNAHYRNHCSHLTCSCVFNCFFICPDIIWDWVCDFNQTRLYRL